MIDHINQTMAKHIVTIEDPIEFLHRDQRSVINQREVGMDTASFKRALRRVLRQDPDVILIGEMRDEETVQTALSAAETGHLVLSTLHTVDATEIDQPHLDFFPPHQHQQARAMIAGTLKGIVSQRLVPTADGDGRVAVCEILRHDRPRPGHDHGPEADRPAPEVIAEGGYYGMQTFDQALLGHLQGRPDHDGGGAAAPRPPARLQAPRRRRRPPRHDDGRPRRGGRRRDAAGARRRLAALIRADARCGSPALTASARCMGRVADRPMQTTLAQFNETQSTTPSRCRTPSC